MDTPRHQLFSGSAFPEDENRVFVLAHFFNHFIDALHFHGNADQPAESWSSAQLLAQQPVLLLELNRTGDALKPGAQLLDAEWFTYVVHGSHAREFHR